MGVCRDPRAPLVSMSNSKVGFLELEGVPEVFGLAFGFFECWGRKGVTLFVGGVVCGDLSWFMSFGFRVGRSCSVFYGGKIIGGHCEEFGPDLGCGEFKRDRAVPV